MVVKLILGITNHNLTLPLVDKHYFPSCPSWLTLLADDMFIRLEVHHMNGYCTYWLINYTSDDPFDYMLNGTSIQFK
jgi:hypothetical protein